MSNLLSSIFSVDALWYVLVVVYGAICVLLIAVIMMQKGKGAGFAGAFGIGPGSETIFGPRGSKSLPVRMTQIGAGLFIFLAFLLSALAGHVGQGAAPEEIGTGDAAASLNELKDLGLGSQAGEETPTAPAPAAETPATPAPAAEAPAPAAETPAPAAEAPAATTEAPAPAAEAPAPAAEAPAPAAEAPAAPAPETPAPADGGAK